MNKRDFSGIAKVEWVFSGLFSMMSVIQCIWTNFDEALENAKTAYRLCENAGDIRFRLMALLSYSYALHAAGDKNGAFDRICELEDVLKRYKIAPFLASTYIGWKIFLLIGKNQIDKAAYFAAEVGLGQDLKMTFETLYSYIHFGYKVTARDKIGIKAASWKLFAPMGIPMWDPLFRNESEFFPGRLAECGIGVTYQRMIWKGLFAAIEVLPLYKSYLDENKNDIGNGFKLYTTFHAGYHIRLFRNRMFVEPQIHCNYWPVDTEAPQGFRETESKWNNYFLFEPNLYIGVNFEK